ncbi:MAG: hypothetical protein WC284_15965 [Candidimonas sp.]
MSIHELNKIKKTYNDEIEKISLIISIVEQLDKMTFKVDDIDKKINRHVDEKLYDHHYDDDYWFEQELENLEKFKFKPITITHPALYYDSYQWNNMKSYMKTFIEFEHIEVNVVEIIEYSDICETDLKILVNHYSYELENIREKIRNVNTILKYIEDMNSYVNQTKFTWLSQNYFDFFGIDKFDELYFIIGEMKKLTSPIGLEPDTLSYFSSNKTNRVNYSLTCYH